MMLKALPLLHFWSVLLLKEQMTTSVRKTLKLLVWSAQNRSISSEICPENNHKIRPFLLIAFRPSLPRRFLRISREIGRFFADFVPKIQRHLTFFSANYQKLCYNNNCYFLSHCRPKAEAGNTLQDLDCLGYNKNRIWWLFYCTLFWGK